MWRKNPKRRRYHFLGKLVEKHSPLVDKEVLPTTNTRFEEIISRGKKEEKKTSAGDENEFSRYCSSMGNRKATT